ncbi:MAG TPA: nuclear transport factor 2 family protein [Phenylobacterium sp.]|nr:nuclear transport factor 2 family protein [Phenylobacterium sp.]
MKAFELALIAALAAAPALAAPPARVDPAPVVAAERAFAEDGLTLGIRRSFLRHSAASAVVFRPDPVAAHAFYEQAPDDRGGPPLVWWPLLAGISRSGDLGFTTGPFTYDGRPGGYYFTVWKKQPDGSWKWIYDGGPPSDMTRAPPKGSPPAYLPVSTARGKYPEAAWAEVRAAEAALARDARVDARAAYARVLSPDARVAGSRAAPADTPQGQAAELSTRAARIEFRPLGGEVSRAGDLAWTYGDARWTQDGKDGRGHYVRIWQVRKGGWALVYDAILKAPPPGAS